MNAISQTATRRDMAATLGWLVDAGVDTLVSEHPRDWLAAPAAPVSVPARQATAVAARAAGDADRLAASCDSLAALAAAVAELRAGALFADGDAAAGVMLIGDAPSADDVAHGRVFAGSPGLLLDRMLASIGRDRGSAYLTNVTYWAGSDAPDAAAAAPLRERQIQLARPRAILALGGAATAALCDVTQGINRVRGQWQVARVGELSIPVLPTFHPAYLLSQPAHKALAWADLCAFRARLDG